MKTVSLIQGTPEWEAHRAVHRNASEASIMLGEFPDVKRSELLRVRATGVAKEINSFLQRIFDDGHRFEALARPIAEEIIGDELYPCVGVDGIYSASFDGLTLLEDTAFEHKTLNNRLREAMVEGCTGTDLPIYHQIQMEQQCMVSGAATVLFMASTWDDAGNLIEERHCWYTPNPELRARIEAGWKQFEADLLTYEPQEYIPAPAGRTPDQLPALHVEVTGMVTASNLAEWEKAAVSLFKGINRDLKTDQDFADADKTVKWCGDIEDQLKAAKQHALGQTASIDALFRTIDRISEEARQTRLTLSKLVEARKTALRAEIVDAGRQAVLTHYQQINATLGQHALGVPPSLTAELGAAIKGKKTIAGLKEAVDVAVANLKIAASQFADQVRTNIQIIDAAGVYSTLFADRVALCASKAPDDLRNLMAARISEHKIAEDRRLEEQREKIRQEEADKLAREQAVAAAPVPESAPEPVTITGAPVTTISAGARTAEAPTASTVKIKLGDLNARIAPLTITADGLQQLGFAPAAKERGATLYRESDFPLICHAMAKVLEAATQKKAA